MSEKRILVVEDDKSLGNLIKEILEANGYEVDHVMNGQEALQLYQEKEFSIVITDIEMPVMDGYELIVHLKEKENDPVIFVITGNDESSFIIDVMKKGVYDYIIKPLDVNDLLIKVNRAYEICELIRVKSISEKEKDIRLESQMEWVQWQKKMEVKDGKIDKSLFQNMHISFSQGIGFGALITLLNLVVSSAELKGDHFVIDAVMMETIKKNMVMAENAINTFSDIEWVISNKLSLEKLSCHTLHDKIIEIRDSLSKYEAINNNKVKVSDKKPVFANKFVGISTKYFDQVINEIIINALKFSEKNSDIFILFDVLQDQLSISIINSPQKDEEGRRGIPMEYENLIFEPFFRMTKIVKEQYNTFDYGLGLTLVDKVIEKHYGKVTGRNITDYTDVSKGPESKVEFNISLPLENG